MALSQTGANYVNQSELQRRDHILGAALDDLASQVEAVRQQANLGQSGPPAAPHPVTAIAVSAANGFASISLTHNNAPVGATYVVEMSTTPNFTPSTTKTVHNSPALTTAPIFIDPAVTAPVYFRAAAKFPASDASQYIYYGGQANPTPVSSSLPGSSSGSGGTFVLPGGTWRVQWGGPVGAGATNFPIAFSGVPVVLLGNINGSVDMNTGSITATGFTLAVTAGSTAYWLAIGPA